jgi:hypothetical protein
MKYERLKENLQILDAHNHGQGKVINLTGWQKNGKYITLRSYSDCREILNKIEQGTLIELPCNVGDKFYICYTCPPEYKELEVCGYREINGILEVCDGLNNWYSVNELLFTREEAEKRLKELQE